VRKQVQVALGMEDWIDEKLNLQKSYEAQGK
jgi:hypothetical protein